MKKRILSLLMALVLVTGLLPGPVLAGETVSVSVTMNTQSVAENVTDYDMSSLPATAQVTVPVNSTIADVMKRWASDQNVTVSGADAGYITAIGDFGDFQSDAFSALCEKAGMETKPEIYKYAGWSYSLNGVYGKGIGVDHVADGDVISFRYGVYMASGTWEQVDFSFLDAYNGLSSLILEAGQADESDFTASQWETLQTVLRNAQSKKEAVDAEADGMWFNYFAEQETALWGPGSRTDSLQRAAVDLTNALHKVVAPERVTFSENNVELPLNRTYTIQSTVLPDGAAQDVIYEAFLGGDSFTVSDSGVITPSKTNGLCWVQVKSKTDSSVFDYFKFKIVEPVQSDTPDMQELMDTIAAGYVDYSSDWVVMDMAAYGAFAPESTSVTSDAAKQAYINSAIGSVTESSPDSNTYAKAILSLTAIGVDPTQLYGVNNNTPIDCTVKLANMTISSHYNAPWVLLANLQGSMNLSETQITALVDLLKNDQMDNGLYGYTWGGEAYIDADTTGTVIAALAPLYDSNADATAIIDRAIAGLSDVQDATTGSFGSANSDAMVIIGLAAMGINPDTDSRFVKDGASLLDGLLSYTNSSATGFTYAGSENALATEQGFRALIAAAQVMTTGEAYNIYDFSGNSLVPGRATGSGSVTLPSDPDTDDTITVYFTLKSNDAYWIPRRTVTVKEGSTVYHAFTKACDAAGLTYVGAKTGYVSSITNGNTTLGEFTMGENSGWLYKVNGVLPEVGLTSCTLSDHDEIVWYYTVDWTLEPGTVMDKSETAAPVFTDMAGHWAASAVDTVCALGLMDPAAETLFAPDDSADRLTIVTALYRLSGGDGGDPVAWAVENGILTGYSDGVLGTADPVTREQLAVFLYRYAGLQGLDGTAGTGLSGFADSGEVSPWAAEAMAWAVDKGLICGTSAAALSPGETATRAQMAVILSRWLETA